MPDDVTQCEKCPRLRQWCQHIGQVKRAQFIDHDYWTKPVPDFGVEAPRGLIVGLAPAAHGANRTGRMFTGDRSGEWLYRALHEAGLASQPTYQSRDDGMVLHGIRITAVCHCAPPDNKPTKEEIANCRPYLESALATGSLRTVLCLGGIAFAETQRILGIRPLQKFAHGAEIIGAVRILASYHPSQQNTFTGRLTQQMLQQVVNQFAESCR